MRKSRGLYFIFLFFMLFFVMFWHDFYSICLFVSILMLPLFSYLLGRYTINKLEIGVQIPVTSLEEKNKMAVCFSIKNHSIFAFAELNLLFKVENSFYKNDMEQRMEFPLYPFEKNEYRWEVESEYCGNVSVQIYAVELKDPLNLFLFRKKISKTAEVVVMPKVSEMILELFRKDVFTAQEEIYANEKGEDVSEVKDVRPYVPGDRPQRIHWKMSLKNDSDDWLVKEYPQNIGKTLVLLLELYQDEEQLGFFDELMCSFYSSMLELVRQEQSFSVCYYQKNSGKLVFSKVTSEEDVLDVLQSVYLMEPYNEGYLAYENYKERELEKTASTIYYSDLSFAQNNHQEIICKFRDKVVISCVS